MQDAGGPTKKQLVVSLVTAPLFAAAFAGLARGSDMQPRLSFLLTVIVLTAVIDVLTLLGHYFHRPLKTMQRSPSFWRRFAGHIIPFPFGILLLMGGMYVTAAGMVLSQLTMLVIMPPVAVGIAFVAAGWSRRVGDSWHCAKCGYERRVEGALCSECGHNWQEPGGVVHGRRQAHWPAVCAGVLIMLVSGFAQFLGFFSSFSPNRMVLSVLPTGTLIDAATTGWPTFAQDEMKVLASRQLSAEEEARLARGLLDQRMEHETLAAPTLLWLEPKVLGATLPSDVCERYFAEMVEVWIDGPDTVTAGEHFTLLIASRHRHDHVGSTLKAEIYFAGVSTDGGATFTDRAAMRDSSMGFGSVWWCRDTLMAISGAPSPAPQIVLSEPGEHEVTIRFWLAAVPARDYTRRITWGADGTPELPAGVAWAKRIDVTATIEARAPGEN